MISKLIDMPFDDCKLFIREDWEYLVKLMCEQRTSKGNIQFEAKSQSIYKEACNNTAFSRLVKLGY